MEIFNEAVVWYQQKIGAYDKQSWETSVEQTVLKNIEAVPKRTAKVKPELIDVDLVRGSTFSKAKPQHGWIAVVKSGLIRVIFLPFFLSWWQRQTSRWFGNILLILYILELITIIVYYLDTGQTLNAEALSLAHLVSPVLLMLSMGLLHSQIVATNMSHRIRKQEAQIRRKNKHKRKTSISPHYYNKTTKSSTYQQSKQQCESSLKYHKPPPPRWSRTQLNHPSAPQCGDDKVDLPSNRDNFHNVPNSNNEGGRDNLHSKWAGKHNLPSNRDTSDNDHSNRDDNVNPLSNTCDIKSKISKSEPSDKDSVKNSGVNIDAKFSDMSKCDKNCESQNSNLNNATVIESDRTHVINNTEHVTHSVGHVANDVLVNDSIGQVSGDVELFGNDSSQPLSYTTLNGIEDVTCNTQEDYLSLNEPITEFTGELLLPNGDLFDESPNKDETSNGKQANGAEVDSSNPGSYISTDEQQLGKINLFGIRNRQLIGHKPCGVGARHKVTNKMDDLSEDPNLSPRVESGPQRRLLEPEVRVNDVNGVYIPSDKQQNTGDINLLGLRQRMKDQHKEDSPPPGCSLDITRGEVRGIRESSESEENRTPEGSVTPQHTPKGQTSETEWDDTCAMNSEVSTTETSCSETDVSSDKDDTHEHSTWGVHHTNSVLNNLASSSDKVSCVMWEGEEVKKADLTVLDVGWAIISKADASQESSDYVKLGVVFSVVMMLLPAIYRIYLFKDSIDDIFSWSGLVQFFCVIFGDTWRENLVISNGLIQRLALCWMFFFLLSVAERTFKQRLLYAKHFCYLTSSRRAKKYELPHFRLNKVRNIKTWLSLRSYLKKRGPQHSVDTIVSAAFFLEVIFVSLMSIELLQDTGGFLDHLGNWELVIWCMALGIYLLRFITLGTNINRKYRNFSVLITEQINLYLHMEQKPHKKDELMLANSVLKLAEDLLKELESPFKISGLSANPFLYNITKVVILSAFSAVLSELLGFKLKLYKIKIRT